MAQKTWQVPFNKINGNMEGYVGPYISRDSIDFKDPYEFNAELQIVSYERGRSRFTFILKDTKTNTTYEMNASKFFEMLQSGVLLKVNGRFGFSKAGANYSLKYINEQTTARTDQPTVVPIPVPDSDVAVVPNG